MIRSITIVERLTLWLLVRREGGRAPDGHQGRRFQVARFVQPPWLGTTGHASRPSTRSTRTVRRSLQPNPLSSSHFTILLSTSSGLVESDNETYPNHLDWFAGWDIRYPGGHIEYCAASYTHTPYRLHTSSNSFISSPTL